MQYGRSDIKWPETIMSEVKILQLSADIVVGTFNFANYSFLIHITEYGTEIMILKLMTPYNCNTIIVSQYHLFSFVQHG